MVAIIRINYINDGNKGDDINTNFVSTKKIDKPKTELEVYQSEVNKDIISYLTFDDLKLPIAYTDNDYYMDHNLYGKKDSLGSIFIDKNDSPITTSNNLIIYGHSNYNKDGNFTFLKNLSNKEYFKNNPYFYYSDEYDSKKYEIIMFSEFDLIKDNDMYVEWFNNYFHNKEELKEILDKTKEYAINYRDYTFDKEIDMITLITCNMAKEDSRYVVFAKKVK